MLLDRILCIDELDAVDNEYVVIMCDRFVCLENRDDWWGVH